ncbi:FecR domain-containing protein [Phenylobacterium sp.]|uniref:FecR family protein n=1 Tax=Phenylobacterium sp. TaxID=1871053 RepID=UPI003565A5D6
MSDLTANPSPTDLEAAAWFMRLSQRSVTTAALYEFAAWRRDDANAKAYADIEATWEATKRLAKDPDIQAATAAALRKRPAKPRLRMAGLFGVGPFAIGATLAVVVLAAATFWIVGLPQTYETRVGEQRLVVLQDGSRVRLNTNSRLIVRFRRDERRVVLARGEAFFEAAHNAARPFVVEADGARVRAIGTKFDVRRDGDAVKVTLVEGRVRVVQANGPSAATLAPNQELTVTPAGITAPRVTDADESAGWTSGRLTFHGMALQDAIAEVNRYAAHKIELSGPQALARQPLSGVFDAGDTSSFVSAVILEFDLQSSADPGGAIRLSPRQPTPGA